MSGEFYSTYRSYLERYMFEGATEGVLLEAYQDLPRCLDGSEVQAASILDVHTRALREVMGIKRDSDSVQWIYIARATEFLAQILIVIDTFLLQLNERVERDHLTGLYNRLALYRLLPQMLEEAQEQGKPIVVAMLDLDDFKRINDQFGHQAGDEALCFVAGLIKRILRNDDLAVRFGGEEFVIVLPATDFAKARIPLERILSQIAAAKILPDVDGLTVSIGVAGYAGRGSVDPDELIRQADEAMYRAKELGKNRVVFAKGDDGE
ncbi:diguanylate cyclase (GGDEF) domain-containing protein [Desulforamulus putei DSM 12395]|uniref:Diguanylate cyclase (GGDEF) domain-containing protein n=1 Tax=Desulforamulus putei DSM 12395 TaxID=1121429 RepID=A0A1M5A1A2_9FIRM|nr:GGDEF domain-containing protein [Desulforamulus putei]SHF24073.1 diguanylate cyclase (GGDEF) domain-containing protein [Desulforamulus putei DSM 12395]